MTQNRELILGKNKNYINLLHLRIFIERAF